MGFEIYHADYEAIWFPNENLGKSFEKSNEKPVSLGYFVTAAQAMQHLEDYREYEREIRNINLSIVVKIPASF